jgi:hypothetical protein
MSGSICDVCRGPSIGVASSGLGAISFAYCTRCAQAGAEPYGMLVGAVADCDGVHGCAEWLKESINATLAIVGKTREQFDADVEQAKKRVEAAYAQWLEEES